MRAYLLPLLQLQRFFIPGLIVLLVWAVWRTFFKRDLALGLALYVCLAVVVDGYMNTGLYLPGLEKGSIRYSEICAFFLLMSSGGRPAAATPSPRFTYLLIGSYFALLFVAALRTEPLLAGMLDYRALIIPQIIGFVVARRGLQTTEDYRRFFLGLTFLAILTATFVFWDVFFERTFLKSDVLDRPIYYHNRKMNRFGGFFLNPNNLGAFVVLVFPPLFVWALNERGLVRRAFALCGLLALVFALMETQSRAAMLAFGVALLLLMIGPCGAVSRGRRVGFLAVFVVVFVSLMPGFIEHASQRFDTINQEATEGRTRESTWRYTLRIIGDHPLAGIGFGEATFMKAMDDYGFEQEFGVQSLDAPHNSYLQVAVYAGVPAALIFIFLNGMTLSRALWRALREKAGADTATIFGLAIGTFGFLAVITPDLQLFSPSIAVVYWVVTGLLLSLLRPQVATAEANVRITKPLQWAPKRAAGTANPPSHPLSWRPVRREQPSTTGQHPLRPRSRSGR